MRTEFVTDSAELQLHERSRFRDAAGHARRHYPRPLGELAFRELTAYAGFGRRFDTDDLIPRLATTVIGCWNRSDWAGYRRRTGPDFTYEEVGTTRRVEDVEAVLTGWRRLKNAFPDASAEIVRIRVENDIAVAEVIWRAIQTGPLQSAAGLTPPSDKRLHVWDLIALHCEHGKIVTERHQLGFLSLMAPLLDGAAHLRATHRSSP